MTIFLTISIFALAWLLKSLVEFFRFRPSAPHPDPDPSQSQDITNHYLLDLEYSLDEDTGFARMPHLSVFNPGSRDAQLMITIYHQNKKPLLFHYRIPARSSIESDARAWPVQLNSRFALKISSSEPIVAQSTQGWNNARNDYSVNSSSKNQRPPRETAKSSMSITALSKECYIADGIIIEAQDSTWIRETEDVIILNPERIALKIAIYLYYGERKLTRFGPALRIPTLQKKIHVPAERLIVVPLTDWAKPNCHYGVRIAGDGPFAAQWLRKVYWYDSAELMSEWSLACVPVK